jgi:hypothetical protein
MDKLQQLADYLDEGIKQLQNIRSTLHLDFNQITNIVFDGIDHSDYPDFSDVFISACDYQGRPATYEELNAINEVSEFVYDEFCKQLF